MASESTAPALYQHVANVYDLMKKQADDHNGDLVWEGKTTNLIKEVGIGNNYYSPVFKYLRGGNYITQLRRGGGGNDSAFQINERPLMENYSRDIKLTGATESSNRKALTSVVALSAAVAKLGETVEAHSRAIMTLQSMVLKGASVEEELDAIEFTLDEDEIDGEDFTDLTPPEDDEDK